MVTMACHKCNYMQWKESNRAFMDEEPYCTKGITNNPKDPNRKNGVCQLYKVESQ